MNPALKCILEKAMDTADARLHPALDEIYVKMVLRPIQLAWRKSLGREKELGIDKCLCCYRRC